MIEFDTASKTPGPAWLLLADRVEQELLKAKRGLLIDGYRREDAPDHVSLTITGPASAQRRLPGHAHKGRADAGDFHVRISNYAQSDFLNGEIGFEISPIGFDPARIDLLKRIVPEGFTSGLGVNSRSFDTALAIVRDLTTGIVPICRREARSGGLPIPLPMILD